MSTTTLEDEKGNLGGIRGFVDMIDSSLASNLEPKLIHTENIKFYMDCMRG